MSQSLAQKLAKFPKIRDQFLESLTPQEATRLEWDWSFRARPEQIPSPGDWFCYLYRAGRGAGKTAAGSNWILSRVRAGFKRIALIGQSKADVRDTMIEVGPSSILRQSPPWEKPVYEPSKRRITWSNGAIATVYSGDEPDQLRGPNFDTAWVDELAKFKYPDETWSNLELALRAGQRPQVFVTTTPRPIGIIRKLINDPSTVDVTGSTFDNASNLSPRYIERIASLYEGTTLGRQELYGEILDQIPGALWTRDMIDDYRAKESPEFERIVVAVDPAVTSKKTSDETGIIVAGTSDGHAFILEDRTGRYTPDTWARKAIALYNSYQAGVIVCESNQGGDVLQQVIHDIDDSVNVKLVHASTGKAVRAEPVVAKYEQGKVHHVGTLERLEDELCTWVPGQGRSPNRLDALVWSLTELFESSSISTDVYLVDLSGAEPVAEGWSRW